MGSDRVRSPRSRGIVPWSSGVLPMGEVLSVTNGSPHPGLSKASVRFGSFEVDLRAGELRKSGVKIKLQGQPLEVLALLLERPGQVVTREELQQKLWAGDT